MTEMQQDRQLQIRKIAGEVMGLAHDGILINMRFLDVALSRLKIVCREQTGAHLFDGMTLYYDPVLLLGQYKASPHYAARLYLHTLLHCIFYHGRNTDKLNRIYWDLATDIAVEHTIVDMELHLTGLPTDDLLQSRLELLRKQAGGLTAEKLYRHFRIEEPSEKALEEWRKLCHYDEHIYWDRQEELDLSQAEWRKLSERIKADLKSFSKDRNNAQSIEQNLREATRERYDYTDFLRKFMVMGETVQINDDEFDYIFYTYGLSLYRNIPLIEPLEYKDVKRIREFVIAIDTSGSVKGELVQTFVQKTYNILKSTESFFSKINLHIIQCDADMQEDVKITCQEEFDAYLKTMTIKGLGGTDFRPVFRYVDELIHKGEFVNLRGLIYFTDGYGTFPERKPEYETAFLFVGDAFNNPDVPPWAIKLVLQKDEI